ncbi:MAG TPA: helix-hairpin-helix domain-containing protein, partial [Rhodothermales bacterium]|nr:helix-hairpin-helix domain-containing protein [Rhodothermales bacterium]
MTNKQIARYLKETAALIELTGGNPFRGRAFDRAARTLEREETAVAELLAEDALTEIPGIGAGLAAQIRELLAYGSFELRDELLSAIPPGLLDALRVKGLGAKKVRRLWKELGITTLDELEQAATMGRLAELDGFGTKSQDNILANVRLLKQYQQQLRYADALHEVAPLLTALRDLPAIKRAEIAGALRRKYETVDAVVLLVSTDDVAAASAVISEVANVAERDTLESIRTGTMPSGLPLRLHLVSPASFGTAWWRLTGSEEFIAAFEAAHGTPAAVAEESEVFAAAGLPFIEPELREDASALKAAANDALPNLITVDDLRGSLHNHSTYSDGTHTLRQMAEYARTMGLSYFGICDHSRSLKVANGMPIERVAQQQEEIRSLNAELAADDGAPFRVFSGIESDILADGALDYPEDVLASFDFIVASVHTRFNM